MVRVKTATKRQQLLEAAKIVFLEQGFDRALMSDISESAKCSKGTLYSYFQSKEELFFEVVIGGTDDESQALFDERGLEENETIENLLLTFGRRFLTTLYSPDFLALRRLAFSDNASVAARRIVYERGVKRYESRLAEMLRHRMEQGVLKEGDSYIAAAQLCALLESEFLLKFLLGVSVDTSSSTLNAAAQRAVSTFITGYRP